MTHFKAHRSPRLALTSGLLAGVAARGLAIRADTDPNRVLAELSTAFADFRQRQDRRMADLEAAMDGRQIQAAAGALNAGGPGGGQISVRGREAIQALGAFARGQVQAGMHSESDTAGGFMVQDELATQIYSLQRDESPMRGLARVVPTRTGTFKQVVNRGGTASGWVAERQARPETASPNLAELSFPAGEIYANPAVSQQLLDDAEYDVGAFLAAEIASEFAEQEGEAFVTGNGIEKPRGFLDYDKFEVGGTDEYGKLAFVKSGNASGFSATNPWQPCVDVLQALKAKHRRNATWLMNSKTQGLMSKWVDGQGLPLWQRAITMGQPDMFLGRPVELDENMPDVAANAFPLAIGNWRDGYLISDRMGTRVIRDAVTNKPFVQFYTTKRVGGGVLDFEAIKLLKIAA